MKKEKEEEGEKRRSQRRYPEKLCFNANCEFLKKFIPHDRRQKFCCEQCRVNFYNDRRSNSNSSVFRNEKLLRSYDKKLARIYAFYLDKDGYCAVWKGILEYEGINLRILVEEQQNTSTGGNVKWFYQYGTELHPKQQNFFIIHKKTTK